MIFDEKPPQFLTSVELEEAIRRHREQTRKLLAEARARRAGKSEPNPVCPAGKPAK
jgi:hypothetical protein